MWDLVGASPTGPTSNGQPDVEDFKAGSMGEELGAPPDRVNFWPATATSVVHVEPKKKTPWYQAVINFQHVSLLKNFLKINFEGPTVPFF
jgi:hypothetical protein